jgi:hypothetical protein
MLNAIKTSTAPAAAPERAKNIAALSKLCGEAAAHVANARNALASVDTEIALDHLDEAIACLKRLSAHGRATLIDGDRSKRRSA